MALSRKRQTEATQRATERRRREDEARRLKDEVGDLTELRLEIEEIVGDSPSAAARYVRRVVIDVAPALFEIQCTDDRCTDGGHDLTYEIMRALRASSTEFSGEDACSGSCRRVLRYVAHAKYA